LPFISQFEATHMLPSCYGPFEATHMLPFSNYKALKIAHFSTNNPNQPILLVDPPPLTPTIFSTKKLN